MVSSRTIGGNVDVCFGPEVHYGGSRRIECSRGLSPEHYLIYKACTSAIVNDIAIAVFDYGQGSNIEVSYQKDVVLL